MGCREELRGHLYGEVAACIPTAMTRDVSSSQE